MAFSMQASSMVSLSKPDSLTMNHGTVWTVRVDTIWPDRVPRFVCSKSGKEYCASWPSNCLNLDKTNPWGAGQMAHGRQKCKSMCSHSWSVSQRSYLGLVRCPAGEGYRWNHPVTSHIHLLPRFRPVRFGLECAESIIRSFELWNCWLPTYFEKMLSQGRSTQGIPRFPSVLEALASLPWYNRETASPTFNFRFDQGNLASTRHRQNSKLEAGKHTHIFIYI